MAACPPTDEQIAQHHQHVIAEHAERQPLVGLCQDLAQLANEYQGSEAFRRQIHSLQTQYRGLRRCRGDGNCFFRAFAFAWYEAIFRDRTKVDQALQALTQSATLLEAAGFEPLAYEDFLKTCTETLTTLSQQVQEELSSQEAQALLEQLLDSAEVSNAMVVYLRFITSAYLRQHQGEYLPFLEEATDMATFCARYVEAMGCESDQIHIIALTRALGVGLRVAYLDGSQTHDTVTIHPFPSADEWAPGAQFASLHLLYRPGHYDILYSR
ncbi:hypothetical protein H4R35_005578 [Dimargaris xerosporica]|nr:hypothetical protein H4R35_005578 [Dimargaris xerosporica]